MGNCYYLVSPAGQRVLDCNKLCPEVEHDAVSFPVSWDHARSFSPRLAAAANVWLAHYGGPGMWVECDAAFSWEMEQGPLPDWCDWPEDDLYALADWLPIDEEE